MKHAIRHSLLFFVTVIFTLAISAVAVAQPMFFDDFEDRTDDQPTLGNSWTWYDQSFTGTTCGENFLSGAGPCDNDGDCNNDYEQDNRNFTNAGADESYYRAGLEVPAWEGALSNMLRVYGMQYNTNGDCQRTLIFQEMVIEQAGPMVFSFDVAKDRVGAPANGEITAAFVKILKTSDLSYEELVFERIETMLDENSLTGKMHIEFVVTEEFVGELLQFGFFNDVAPGLGQSWANAAAMYDNITLDMASIGPAHSGSFYNVDQAGHGFSAEFGLLNGAPFAVVYWYTYDNLGNPIFFIGQDAVFDGNTVTITFYSPTGMIFGVFDPTPVFPLDVAGTGVFEFSDSNTAVFNYTPSAFSTSTWGHSAVTDLPLIKLFGIPADFFFDLAQ